MFGIRLTLNNNDHISRWFPVPGQACWLWSWSDWFLPSPSSSLSRFSLAGGRIRVESFFSLLRMCEMAEQWQCLLKMRIRNSEARSKYWRLANGDHCSIVASPLDLGLVKWWAWSFSLASHFDNICKRLCDICDNNNPKVFDVKCLCENSGNFVLCQWEQGVRACKYTAS